VKYILETVDEGKDGEQVEQIVFRKIAEEPQGRMNLCGLAQFNQVLWYTWRG
jgi:hypothetical protein